MLKIKRGTFLHVESELYAYHDTLREIVRIKNDLLQGKTSEDENVGGGKSNLPGDPTGRTAILLVSHKRLEQMMNVVDAIESVVSGLPDDRQKLIQLRYWTRPQTLTWDGIAAEIPAHRATVFRWRDGIITAIAARAGWR
ncbi:transcriptional regulator [Paenibacillus lycopersici]|uniref:Transcriptional regulator n=1 Tax=Paenibacillus lycopersici TaxID=2704462 RepID=A0A6C0FXA7_9BACL|nr:transcriptional regulator [Paenibacillus lycopersici]QHT61708.1 transcriptional regulator [Paenibacillus lycopersici]